MARGDHDRVHVPVDLDRDDVLELVKQTLVAQVADRQRLRRGAQRHQGENLAFVDIERQRVLAGDGRDPLLAVFVERGDVVCRRARGVRKQRAIEVVGRVQFYDCAEGAEISTRVGEHRERCDRHALHEQTDDQRAEIADRVRQQHGELCADDGRGGLLQYRE